MSDLLQRVLLRFLRGACAGAISTMILLIPTNVGTYSDLFFWLQALLISGIVGFITGGLLALDKYSRDESAKETI